MYPILRNLNSTICYHSSKHSLETSVILSLGKCARHIYSIQVQSVELFYVVFFSIESCYTTWNCFWITAYKTSNNVLQISCCEFEYFSMKNDIPRGGDSATKEPDRRTSGRECRAHSFMEKWHPQQSTYPWEVFSADLFAIFKAIYLGNCTWFNLSRLTAPFIWFRELELDYGYLMNYCLSRRISEREIVGVWKLAMLVTADWSTGEFRRWREMLESDVKTSLD